MCDCISKAIRLLEDEHGLEMQVEDGIRFVDGHPIPFYAIATKKGNGHRGNPLIIQHCPMCGDKLAGGLK